MEAPVADQAGAELDRDDGDREADGVLQGQCAADVFRWAGAGGEGREVRRVGDDAGAPKEQQEQFCPVWQVDRKREQQAAGGGERQGECSDAGAAQVLTESAASNAAEGADTDYGKRVAGDADGVGTADPGEQEQAGSECPESV